MRNRYPTLSGWHIAPKVEKNAPSSIWHGNFYITISGQHPQHIPADPLECPSRFRRQSFILRSPGASIYDRKHRISRHGVDDDKVATGRPNRCPGSRGGIWKRKAKRLIAQVKPRAYQEAGKYLRKAAKVMAQESKQAKWNLYLQGLRESHARKVRLMDVLDSLEDNPIIRKKR